MHIAPLIVAGAMIVAQAAQAEDAQAQLRRYDCDLCHASDEAKTGPSYVDIAAKYRDNPKAVPTLTAVVRNGAHGTGPWHMPPLPQVPDADARKMVEYILSTRK